MHAYTRTHTHTHTHTHAHTHTMVGEEGDGRAGDQVRGYGAG